MSDATRNPDAMPVAPTGASFSAGSPRRPSSRPWRRALPSTRHPAIHPTNSSWLEGVVASVNEAVPQDLLVELTRARNDLTQADAWKFYQRLVDKWGSHNFSPAVKARMAEMKPTTSAAAVEAWEKQDEAKSRLLAWMSSYDVFLCPVSSKSAQPFDLQPGKDSGWGGPGNTWQYTGVFNSTGWPVTVVRCGSSADGKLPIGVQIVAAPWRDDITLAVASYLEGRSGGWQKPPI